MELCSHSVEVGSLYVEHKAKFQGLELAEDILALGIRNHLQSITALEWPVYFSGECAGPVWCLPGLDLTAALPLPLNGIPEGHICWRKLPRALLDRRTSRERQDGVFPTFPPN